MIITVLGANGKTGMEVGRQAIEVGHSVHAVVRRAESLSPRAGLEVCVGDVTDPAVIAKASWMLKSVCIEEYFRTEVVLAQGRAS